MTTIAEALINCYDIIRKNREYEVAHRITKNHCEKISRTIISRTKLLYDFEIESICYEFFDGSKIVYRPLDHIKEMIGKSNYEEDVFFII